MNFTHEHTIETWKELAELKAENERLKRQLENAVELPCKVGDTVYYIKNRLSAPFKKPIIEKKTISELTISFIDSEIFIEAKFKEQQIDINFELNNDFYLTKQAAEARLKELEGERC